MQKPAKPYSIILADDHAMLRGGLRQIISSSQHLTVIGEAGDGLELIKILSGLNPDMIILDISMPRLRGLEAINEIKALHPDTKILILTMHRDKEYVQKAISSGAHGYLLKEEADEELHAAIEKIRHGSVYICPRLMAELTDDWAKIHRGEYMPNIDRDILTVREREILKLIAEGNTSKEIASLLFISVRTVEHHRANLTRKLDLKKTAELVKYAIDNKYM